MALNERDCFTEKNELKPMSLACPQCRHRDDYQIKWIRRTKKARPPGGGDPHDRAFFEKLRDHLYRIDDQVNCTQCRRRFEIPSHQSMVFL
ncbi:MAG: hypothetical protein HQ485_12185 [Acidobacteria bacterium]|jgi:uncharacterized protein YbaR (Trm112 family)|nr:hypothetical protein [Acidobacteriota bacterium]